jgi:hypothetical protein
MCEEDISVDLCEEHNIAEGTAEFWSNPNQ